MRIKYVQLIFNKGAKAIQWSRYTLFNKWCWNNRIATGQKIKIYESRYKSYTFHKIKMYQA